MKILFANIWNRNLIVKWNYDWIDDKWFIKKDVFKQKTKEILENFDEWKNKLQVNILDILPLEKFDKIYLVWTNQGTNEQQDTIYAARIIQKLLGYNIDVLEYTSNPTDRKAVLYYYKKVIWERINKNDKLYLFVSGGVPAMKEAMVWAALSEDIDVVILEAINWKLVENKVEEIYLKEIYKKSLKLFISNYDWFWAEKLIEKNQRLFGDKIDFLYKLKYTNARFNFDFSVANFLVDKMNLSLNEEDVFQKVEIEDDLKCIKELLDNIEITYKKWEYTMLLGKVFRLQEAIYRYIFEKNTGISTKKDEKWDFAEFVNYIENNVDLKNFLVSNNVNYDQPNTFVLAKILSYFIEKKILEDDDRILFQIAASVDKLKDLRNLSIMAHWWQWVSKKDLDNKKLLEKISKIKEIFNKKENIFDKINKFLLEEIKNL